MIRSVLSRFRVVAPPAWLVVVWLALFAAFEGTVLYFERQVGMPINVPIRPGRILLIAGAALLGFHRVRAFHPYFQPDYLRWLKSTPWTVRKPLPAGPLELVLEDLLSLGGLMLFSMTQTDTHAIELINVFLFSHLISLVATFWWTGASGFGYCGALFLGFVPRLWKNPFVDLAVLTTIYLFVHEGLWRSLASFPWSTEGHSNDPNHLARRQEKEFGRSCGWPYDRFHRDVLMAKGIRPSDALLISMLTGWWFYALGAWVSLQMLFQVAFMLPTSYMFQRGAHYFRGYAPPISFGGRIATFRWIIPGYDQASLFIWLTILAFPSVIALHAYLGMDPRQAAPVLSALLVLIALTSPPTLRRWRLTGQHRLVPAIPKASKDYVQVG
jgi:hypothetical protein